MRPQRSRPVNLHLWVRILHKMVMHRLSENVVESAFRPGRYCDGGGLYLVVQPGGSKSWICRVQRDGTRRDIGLGSAAVVTLAHAREKARATRDQSEIGRASCRARGCRYVQFSMVDVSLTKKKTRKNQ